jgi:hypothetical protein
MQFASPISTQFSTTLTIRLLFVLLTISLLHTSCTKHYQYHFDRSYIDANLEEQNKTKISHTTKFIGNLLSGYRNTINSYNINTRFKDSLEFIDPDQISADYYLSTFKELFLEIYKSKENKLTVYGTDFSVQYYILKNLQGDYLRSPNGNFQRAYNQFKTNFVIEKSVMVNMTTDGTGSIKLIGTGKCFSIDESSLVLFNNFQLIGLSEDGKDTIVRHYFRPDRINIVSGSNDIQQWLQFAKQIGANRAADEIRRLFTQSPYFRSVMANDSLRPLAEQILIKQAKAKIVPGYEYSQVDFEHDKKIIKLAVDSSHISLPADSLFAEAATKIRTGYILWFYSGFEEFEIQWSVATFGYLLAIVLISKLKWYKKFITIIKKSALLGTLGAICGWIWLQRPSGMGIYLWIIPVLPLPLLFLFLYWKELRSSNSM